MSQTKNPTYSLNLAWLYPELMSTYGDRGNIYVLQKIAEDNAIELIIKRINQKSDASQMKSAELIFMGGAQDLQQEIVSHDLNGEKGNILKDLINNNTPGLFICGAYQFLGNYYLDAYGNKIPGLKIFDMFTQSDPKKPRLIGNIAISPSIDIRGSEANRKVQVKSSQLRTNNTSILVGFENHGGRTFLTDKSQAFAKVLKGFGNNGKDLTEGIHFKNAIGTYLHGPILPSNPEIAVDLLETALKIKYNKDFQLSYENELSKKAKIRMLKRMGFDL